MAKRKERVFDSGSENCGLRLTVCCAGIEVSGWYDHYGGIEGLVLSWEQIEKARQEVGKTSPKGSESRG